MSKTIQIGNLDETMNDQALAALFAPSGVVHTARLAIHQHTGQNTGVGFVVMECDSDGDTAIASLNGSEHLGRVLSVCWSHLSVQQQDSRGVP